MTIKYATKRLIDSVWTLGYIETSGGIEIVSHNRENPIGYKQEKTLPNFKLIEDENRIVQKVIFPDVLDNSEPQIVLNRQHVFSYG